MGHLKVRVGGRKQSQHREWMCIVAAGSSVDADMVGQIILRSVADDSLLRQA